MRTWCSLVIVVAAAGVVVGGTRAATDPVAKLEQTLLRRYPAVAGPLIASSPFRSRGLRVLYVSGAVSVWFQAPADRRQVCAAARVNGIALRDAITGQVLPTADDVRFWASRGISPTRAVEAFRRGIVRACTLRGG